METWTIGNVSLSLEEFRARYQGVYKNTMPEWEREIAEFLEVWYKPKDTVTVQTSGSTGSPKLIELSKDFMRESARRTLNYFDLNPGDHILLCVPVKFIAGKMMIVRAIEGKLNLHAAPPTTHPLRGIPGKFKFAAMIPLQIITTLKEDVAELERIEHLIIGGAALSPETRKILAGRKQHYYETYGMTETATHVAVRRISKSNSPLFEALPGISFSINEHQCLIVECGGKNAFQIQTHDMVNLKSPTSFEWLGRIDNVINSGGIKIHPELIEEKLSSIIKNRYYIAGVSDENLGQKVVLIIEGNTLDSKDLASFKKELSNVLDKYSTPKEIHFVPRLSETPNHKIIRKWPL